MSAGISGHIPLTENLMAGLQTGGAGYYNRCLGMRWSSNLFRNNSANSGGAGLELNQCTGDVDHCSFHQNQVCADADKISNTLLVCDNLPGGRRAEWMLLVVSCHSDCCQIVHNICNDICSLACTHELALMQSRERRVAESSWTSVHPAC